MNLVDYYRKLTGQLTAENTSLKTDNAALTKQVSDLKAQVIILMSRLALVGSTASAPVAPTISLGTATSSTQPVTITGGSGATSWQMQYAIASSGSWNNFGSLSVGDTSITVTGLTASTSYDYRIIATNAVGSTNSNTATGSTAGSGAGLTIVGSALTLTSTGLGSRLLQATKYFDNYESRTTSAVDTAIGLSDLQGNGNPRPAVATDKYHSGSKSLKMTYPVGAYSGSGVFPTSGISTTDGSDTFYVGFWGWFQHTSGSTSSPIFKLVRGGSGSPYSGTPRAYQTIRPSSSGVDGGGDMGFVTPGQGTYYDNIWWTGSVPSPFSGGSWHFVEYVYKLATPGGTDGYFRSYCDGVQNIGAGTWRTSGGTVVNGGATNDTGSTATIEWVMSPFDGMDSYGTADQWDFWVDEMAIDVSAARIVLTNNATYSSSTKFAIQPITAWSSTQITATYNASTFTSGETVYAHVWLTDGTKFGTVYTASAP